MDSKDLMDYLTEDGLSHALVIKVSYGLGARAGSEQIGFRKSYRPFVQLIGRLRDIETGEFIWSDDLIVFGPKPYRGSDANAENLSREELVQTYEQLNAELASLLIASLNGEQVPARPPLVGLSSRMDLSF